MPGGEALETASRNGHHGQDVYGPSGRSPWLDVDWREHQRWVSVCKGSPSTRSTSAKDPPLVFVHGLSGSWPNWLEQLPVFADAPISRDRDGPARLRPFPDAARSDHDLRVRAPAGRPAGRAGNRRGDGRRQLDGRVRLGRARDRVPRARRAPRARLPRGPEHIQPSARNARAAGTARGSTGSSPRTPRGWRRSPTRSHATRSCATQRWASSRATPAASRPPWSPSSCAAPASPASSRRWKRTSTTTSATASPRSPARR